MILIALHNTVPFGQVPMTSSKERTVLRGLLRYGPSAYDRAIMLLPFGVRSLWIHAYQSWLWNHVASYRLMTYGPGVMIGDLLDCNDGISLPDSRDCTGQVRHESKDSEVVGCKASSLSSADDVRDVITENVPIDDLCNETMEEPMKKSVRYATNQDIADDNLSNLLRGSIVLPLFGSNILYPENDVGRYEGYIGYNISYLLEIYCGIFINLMLWYVLTFYYRYYRGLLKSEGFGVEPESIEANNLKLKRDSPIVELNVHVNIHSLFIQLT